MSYVVRATSVAVLAVGLAVTGCARGGKAYEPPPTSERVATSERAEREAQLRELVQRRKITEAHAREENQTEVKREQPYFFKEYATYPDTAEPEFEFSETESRSAPLLATAIVPKVRFATRFHRERDAAIRDETFIRDTGYERQEYALRNGRWVSLGDTFIAETSEVQVNGAWMPVQEEPESSISTEEATGGWFKRTWDRVTGGSSDTAPHNIPSPKRAGPRVE
jgi:hypothetical protein